MWRKQSWRIKFISAILGAIFFGLISPRNVFATVYINEFSSYGSDDWVELYRTEDENISQYKLKDSAGHTKNGSECTLPCNGQYCVCEWGDSNLNKSSDEVITLYKDSTQIDQVSYCNIGCDIGFPGNGQSGGRLTDGADSWVIFTTTTKGLSNDGAPILSSPSPSPSASSNSSSTVQATYKINEIKDSKGNTISSVSIYVDNQYIHHYAPETLNFCENCQCYSSVSCGFGNHTIRLEKEGYEDWSETKDFSSGNNFEVNPQMSTEGSATSPSPSPSRSPSASSKSSVKPSSTPIDDESSETEKVLAQEAASESTPSPSPSAQPEKKSFQLSVPLIISLSGALFLLAASFPFIKSKIKWPFKKKSKIL